MSETYDFSGYATRYGVKCSDGRTILPDAFKHHHGMRVPLVYQHDHVDPSNVLGHAVFEHRPDGLYAYGKFNNTENGKIAKELVQSGDTSSLSIFANKLVEKAGQVSHGMIRELSLVLSGANSGATIDNVMSIVHAGDSGEDYEDSVIISFHDSLEVAKKEDMAAVKHADSEMTIEEVFNTLNEDQKNAVYAIIAAATEGESAAQSAIDDEESTLKHNVFSDGKKESEPTLTQADFDTIMTSFKKGEFNGSFKAAFLAHAGTYGINNIEYLFPDARAVSATPEMITRKMGWVQNVLNGTKHVPFSRIKSIQADITVESARALGYVRGNLKKDEVFGLLTRTTTPQTIYKKQKLDRDDIVDITDFDVVGWLKAEMRVMLDEEIARAVLVGDGREVADEDRIKPIHVRNIWTDADLYAHHLTVTEARTTVEIMEDILRERTFYRGAGNPSLYAGNTFINDMLLLKDTTGRRLYPTMADLASALRVSEIVEVPIMEGLVRENGDAQDVELLAILVNMGDYTIGADKGGAVNFFDDFDIDYNQQKYLLETRISGALTKVKTAMVVEQRYTPAGG